MPEDNLAQFKQILTKLPADKRESLHKRLKGLSPSEREKFIANYVKHYNEAHKKSASKKPASANTSSSKKNTSKANSSVQKKGNQPSKNAKKNQSSKQHEQQKTTDKKPVNKPAENPKPAKNSGSMKKIKQGFDNAQKKLDPKLDALAAKIKEEESEEKVVYTKESSVNSIVLGLVISLLVVGIGYFVYLFNKTAIDKKFNQMFGMPAETFTTETSDNGIMGSEPRTFPTDTPTPVPATPTPTPVPLMDNHPDLKGKTIVIDPGHQAEPDQELESALKGTSAEKEKATTGAVGVLSGAKEYELTLEYALVLKEYLEGCGAKVILTRDSNDTSISNMQRAKIANDNNADYFIRLHADSAPEDSISGVKVYVPATGKYSKSAPNDGKKLAETVAKEIGSTSLGSVQSKMYTGLNYADSIKSYQLVIGYLSNSNDDALLTNEETPYKVAIAIAEFLRK